MYLGTRLFVARASPVPKTLAGRMMGLCGTWGVLLWLTYYRPAPMGVSPAGK